MIAGSLGMLVRFHFLIWALITCMCGLCGKIKLWTLLEPCTGGIEAVFLIEVTKIRILCRCLVYVCLQYLPRNKRVSLALGNPVSSPTAAKIQGRNFPR